VRTFDSVQANAGSFPRNNGLNLSGSDRIDQVAVRVYVHEGQRYCFFFNGWHGPGWYRCGFAMASVGVASTAGMTGATGRTSAVSDGFIKASDLTLIVDRVEWAVA